jgi:hypothetical protein
VADRTRNITSLKAFFDKIGEDSTGNFTTHKRLGELKYSHLAISKRKNANTAKVALARDMLKVVYHILKEKRPFYKKEQIRSVAAPALVGV